MGLGGLMPRTSGTHRRGDGDHNARLKMAAANVERREVAYPGIDTVPYAKWMEHLPGAQGTPELAEHQQSDARRMRRAAKAGIVNPDWHELARRRERTGPTMLLCDRVVQSNLGGVSPQNVTMLKQAMRNAHRVIFDEAAGDRLAEVCSQCADLVIEHETFARQPWNPMWVEMLYGNAETDNDKIGYLFIDHNVYTFYCDKNDHYRLGVGDLIYHLHQPEREWWIRDDLSPEQLDEFFLSHHAETAAAHVRAAIRANYSCSVFWESQRFSRAGFDKKNGELIHILSVLLLLNRPGLVRYHAKPAGRTFVSGKSRPYMSHTTLHFTLDPKESLQALRNEQREVRERAQIRWHQVRDHYCHSKEWRKFGAIGCIHTPIQTDEHWIPAPDLPPLECSHWVCSQCEGRRWRRKYKNGRGSAAVGFVHQDMTIVEGPTP